MGRNLTMFIYLFVSLIIISFVAKSLDLLVDKAEPNSPSKVVEISAYRDEMGNLKYASGSCLKDSDCVPTGCSDEVCGSEDLVTTCEVKEDAPADEYSCGCLGGSCAWITK